MAQEPVTSAPPSVAPQSHIRTFAQDVARLSGKPFPPSPKKPVAPQTPAPPPTPAPEPPPAQIIPKAPTTSETREAVLARLRAHVQPIEPLPETPSSVVIPKAPSTAESREDVLARLKAKASASSRMSEIALPTPSPAPQPHTPPPPKERQRITTPLSSIPGGPNRIHTYKTDFAEHAEAQNASRLSVLAAEADAMPRDRVVFKEKKPFPTALVAGLFLVVLGATALYGAYHVVTNQPIPVLVVRVPSLVAPDERREVSSSSPASEFEAGVYEPLQEGMIRIMYTSISTTSPEGTLTTLPQSGGTLLRSLMLPMPDVLARSIMDESTIGAIHEGGEQRAFFILRVDSYERSFAGMLEWERRMNQDLAYFYPAYPHVGTTTPETLPSFKDELVGSRDVRVLRDTEGRSLMLYGFRDKETLIIARNEASYLALIARLAVSRGE